MVDDDERPSLLRKGGTEDGVGAHDRFAAFSKNLCCSNDLSCEWAAVKLNEVTDSSVS